jgi:hypothetical protein
MTFTVHTRQLALLEDIRRGEAEAVVGARLRFLYPGAAAGEHGSRSISEVARRSVEAAARFRIGDLDALTRLAGLMLQFGYRFERSPDGPAALQVLKHPTLDGTLKVQTLGELLDGRAQGRIVSEASVDEPVHD